LVPHAAEIVIMNPPFHDAATSRASPDPGRAAAHMLAPGDLDRWIAAAADLLRPRGVLSLIFRADGLPALLAALARRFGEVDIMPIHPWPTAAATRIVVRARLASRAPLRILPGFILQQGVGGTNTKTAK